MSWFKKMSDAIKKSANQGEETNTVNKNVPTKSREVSLAESIIKVAEFCSEIEEMNLKLEDDRLKTMEGTVLAILEIQDYCIVSEDFCIPMLNERVTKIGKPKVYFEC